jgi:hypothetical protein
VAEYKRQHTVTKSYLRRFLASEGTQSLCQYEKQTGSVCVVNIEDATVGKYVYSFRNRNGLWNHQAEQHLGTIESGAGPLLSKLELGEKLSNEQRYRIALFIATMVRRPRAVMDHFIDSFLAAANDPVQRIAHFESMLSELSIRFSDQEIEQARHRIAAGDLDWSIDAAKAGQFRAWFKQLPRYAGFIADMHWTIWRANRDQEFLTCDAPAYVRREGNDSDPGIVGVMRADLRAELTMPLSRKSLLIARHAISPGRLKASKSRVRELNARTIRMAHRFIYSSIRSQDTSDLVAQNREFSAPLPNLTWPRFV